MFTKFQNCATNIKQTKLKNASVLSSTPENCFVLIRNAMLKYFVNEKNIKALKHCKETKNKHTQRNNQKHKT